MQTFCEMRAQSDVVLKGYFRHLISYKMHVHPCLSKYFYHAILSMSNRWKQTANHTEGRPVESGSVSTVQATCDFPSHWKPMSGLSARFPVFQHGLVCVDTTFACEILQHAFVRQLIVKPRTPVAIARAPLAMDSSSANNHDTSMGKRNFHDFTVSNSDENDNMEVFQVGDSGVLVLSAILHKLEQKNVRILAIEQLQNAQTYIMQQTFMRINQITTPYETVYHGTHATAVDGIIMEGLKTMYSKRLLFGLGTYVSRSFQVASMFAKPDHDGMRYILVVHCHTGSIKHVGNDEGMHDFCTMSADGTTKILHHTKEVDNHNYLITGSDCQVTCHALIKVRAVDWCKPDAANIIQPRVAVQTTQQVIDMGLFTSFISNLNNASNASIMQLHQSLGLGGGSSALGDDNGASGGDSGALGDGSGDGGGQ